MGVDFNLSRKQGNARLVFCVVLVMVECKPINQNYN